MYLKLIMLTRKLWVNYRNTLVSFSDNFTSHNFCLFFKLVRTLYPENSLSLSDHFTSHNFCLLMSVSHKNTSISLPDNFISYNFWLFFKLVKIFYPCQIILVVITFISKCQQVVETLQYPCQTILPVITFVCSLS